MLVDEPRLTFLSVPLPFQLVGIDMNEITFLVEEDPEGGYTARALGYPIFTEADSEADLKVAVSDALKCHFDKEGDIPKIIRLHFVREQIIVNA
jgi:hypothetical protein